MRKYFLLVLLSVIPALTLPAATNYIGDFNGDEVLDMADMAILANAVKSGVYEKVYDLNNSGRLDDPDLHRLADLIINGTLIENNGMNVGIGDWDEDGEDYGGTIKSGRKSARKTVLSQNEVSFTVGPPKLIQDLGALKKYSLPIGFSSCSNPVSGVLVNLQIPDKLYFDDTGFIELDSELADGHKLYGTPKIFREEWGDHLILRFIILSADLNQMKDTSGTFCNLIYRCGNVFSWYEFKDSQVVIDGKASYVENKWGELRWDEVKLKSISTVEPGPFFFDIGEIRWIDIRLEPEDATNQTLHWESENTDVVTIDKFNDLFGRFLFAHSNGKAVIHVWSDEGPSLRFEVEVGNTAGVSIAELSDDVFEIYGITGVIIRRDADKDFLNSLAPGVYILRRGNTSYKVLLP